MRKYLTPVQAVTDGTVLEADDGFTCMEAGELKEVWLDDDGIPCVQCRDGTHSLDGQLDDKGAYYVGFIKIR